MARAWPGPLPDEPTPARALAVPPPATHARLRDRLVELLGLDEDCSDDAIVVAVHLLLPA